MKYDKILKIRYATLLIVISLFLGGITMVSPKKNIYTTKEPQGSALSLDPISILVYTEYADTNSSNQEFANTISAIDTYYGSNYNYQMLTNSSNLGSKISNYDVFLIPEQKEATTTEMENIGQSWSNELLEFTSNGGVVICLDYANSQSYYGITQIILDEAGLITFTGTSTKEIGNTIYLNETSDALAWGIDSSWEAPDGTLSAQTSDGTIVIDDGSGDPVVVHKTIGEGHVVYCGFDFYDIEPNCGKILANALRLTHHVIFDDSHSNWYEITDELNGFATELVEEGFAVSTMTSFSPSYLKASEVLVIVNAGTNYSNSEIYEIETYMNDDNGVLVCTDFRNYGDELDGIIENFGFRRNKTSYISDSDDYTVEPGWPKFTDENIKSHIITSRVFGIEMYAISAFISIPSSAQVLISTDNDSTSTWGNTGCPANDIPVAASYTTPKGGRLVVVSDFGFMRSEYNSDGEGPENYYEESNAEFLVGSILWLSASYTLDFTDAIPGFPLGIVIFTAMVSCAVIIIFIYRRKK